MHENRHFLLYQKRRHDAENHVHICALRHSGESLQNVVPLALCGCLQTQHVCCALHPMSGEDGILVAEVCGVQHASSAQIFS